MRSEAVVPPGPGTGGAFDAATAVVARDGSGGVFDARLDPGWRIGGGIHGGLLLATMGRAVREAVAGAAARDGGAGHPDPFSISAYYLSASPPGPAVVHTEVIRRGRNLTSAAARLTQLDADGAEVERLRVLASYGDLDTLTGEVHTTATPPVLPPPGRCAGPEQAPPPIIELAPFTQRMDVRLDPAIAGWAVGEPSGEATMRGWWRMPDAQPPDALMLLLAADALPPVTFGLGLFGWVPTIELTVHVRARPAPGWLRVTHSSRNLAGGFLEEDCEIWDSADRLVAQSRQLARVPS